MEISILIVDDDKILVDKLEETVDWKGLNISMVFTANNIRQAQKILEEFPVDMLLCDIDMPQGSGLELLEWMRNQEMDTECIFLSSYANFAYVQKALRLSSREYLLKPVSNYELERVLGKMAAEITSRNIREEAKPEKGELWKRILLEEIEDVGLFQQLYQKNTEFHLVLVKVFMRKEEPEKRKKSSLCKFVLSSRNPEAAVTVADNLWIIVEKKDKKDKEALQKETEELAKLLMDCVQCNVCLYTGSCCTQEGVQKLWRQLKHLEQTCISRRNGVVIAEETELLPVPAEASWECWQKMMQKPDSFSSVLEAMQTFLKDISEKKAWDLKNLRHFMRKFHQFLYVYLAEQKLEFEEVFDCNEFEQREEEAYTFLEGCMEFVAYVFQTLQRNHLYHQSQENAVECVKEYINKNLDQDLSRGNLAKEVYLSEDYLSRMFKTETGISLTGYIAEQRVEKAKEYLEYSNLTVSKIALEVGYHNFSYFSKTFRDITGFTPNEYRNNKKTN